MVGAIWIIFAPIVIMCIIDFAYFWKDKDNKNGIEHKISAIIKLKSLVIGLLASLINPRGIEIYSYFIKMLFTGASKATETIAEWKSIEFISYYAAFVFIGVFVSFAFSKDVRELKKESITKVAIISFWGIGMLRYCRLTPIFAFTVLLWGYEFVRNFIEYIIKKFKFNIILKITYFLFTIFGLVYFVFSFAMGIDWLSYYFMYDEKELLKDGFPYESIRFLKENNVRDKIYNDDWGSWMLFNDIPTFMDGRCDPFVEEFSPGNNQFVEAANADSLDKYLAIFKKYDIEYVFLKYDKDTLILLESTGEWERVVIEPRAMLLKKKE